MGMKIGYSPNIWEMYLRPFKRPFIFVVIIRMNDYQITVCFILPTILLLFDRSDTDYTTTNNVKNTTYYI